MEISYDKETDIVYIKFKVGEFYKNKKIDPLTIMDLDQEGNILGIEFLDASKRMTEIKHVHLKNLIAIIN